MTLFAWSIRTLTLLWSNLMGSHWKIICNTIVLLLAWNLRDVTKIEKKNLVSRVKKNHNHENRDLRTWLKTWALPWRCQCASQLKNNPVVMSKMLSFFCNMQRSVFRFTERKSHTLLSSPLPLSLVSGSYCKEQKWQCPVLVSTQLKRDLRKEPHIVSLRKIIETIAIPLIYSKENNTAAL